MFIFHIKDTGPDINIVLTRSMLAIGAVICLMYRNDYHFALNIVASVILIIIAFYLKSLVLKFKIKALTLLTGAAVLLFITTGSMGFAVVLITGGLLMHFFYKKPLIQVSKEGITIKKFYNTAVSPWHNLNNVILKDGVLTIDFKSNKILQVYIDDADAAINISAFNSFCNGLIKGIIADKPYLPS